MRHYDITLMTIPGRDAKPAPTMSRLDYLRRYLAERKGFEWTDAYKAAQTELAKLDAALLVTCFPDDPCDPTDPCPAHAAWAKEYLAGAMDQITAAQTSVGRVIFDTDLEF